MKRTFGIVASCAIAVLLGVIIFRPAQKSDLTDLVATSSADPAPGRDSRQRSREQTSSLESNQATRNVLISSTPAIETIKPAIPFILGSPDAKPDMGPEVVLGKLRTVISQYRSMFGSNPVGNNPEITEALNGGNPKQARFITEESGLRINGRGELVDSWGTPFFFHQLSGTEMEIRSAGPDLKMWTRDDIVTK